MLKIKFKAGFEIPKSSKLSEIINLHSYIYQDTRKHTSVTTLEIYKDRYVVPRNVKKFMNNLIYKGKVKIKDERVINSSTYELDDNFQLRDYQKEPIRKLIENLKNTKENSCVLQAQTGFGKTITSIYVIKELGQKTLFLADRNNLVEQTYKEYLQNLKKGKVVILNSKNKSETADIYITTLQFLNKNPDVVKRLQKEIGFVIVDEVHIVSVGALTKVITQFPAKYRLGMSATPTRSDGLTKAIYDHFSNNVVIGKANLLSVNFIQIQTPYSINFFGKSDAGKAWEALYSDFNLLNEVGDFVKKLLKKDRHILIYSTYQAAQANIQLLLKEKGIEAEIINANTKKAEREKIMNDFKQNKIKVIISGTILQKGISIPILDTIVNLSNHTKESLEQAMGRLRREYPNKKDAYFWDFCFTNKGGYKCNLKYTTALSIKAIYKDKVEKWNYNKWLETFKLKSYNNSLNGLTEIDLDLPDEIINKTIGS